MTNWPGLPCGAPDSRMRPMPSAICTFRLFLLRLEPFENILPHGEHCVAHMRFKAFLLDLPLWRDEPARRVDYAAQTVFEECRNILAVPPCAP